MIPLDRGGGGYQYQLVNKQAREDLPGRNYVALDHPMTR